MDMKLDQKLCIFFILVKIAEAINKTFGYQTITDVM